MTLPKGVLHYSGRRRNLSSGFLSLYCREVHGLCLAPSFEGVCPQDCLNGGFCSEDDTCDCSERQANGSRCQTVPNSGEDREGICRSWGQYHFETFDGLYFYFPGKCSYILAKDCWTTEPRYMVEVHNSGECTSSHYSCSRSISLFFPNEEEITILGHSVTKGGIRLPLPQTVRHAFFERLADYILVKTTFGFSLAWDGFSGVYIKLTEEHKGKPCGLCGNYNGDMSDDLNASYSMLTEDVSIFGNSWMSQSPSDAPCESVSLNFPSPCRDKGAIISDIIAKCEVLLGFPFFTCREYVQPNSYVASCINDLCMMDDSDTQCRAITEYARACSHAGYPLMDWRDDFPACTDQCEDSFVHRDCISCCPPTCTFEKECLGSSLHCLDGCYCPDGLVMENGTCISISNCPCIYHGTVYPKGSHLQEGCNMCICSGGVWNCTDNNCPAECSVTGDLHFTTFDGRIFTFLGTCQYIFAKSRRSNKFTVTLQNAPCGQSLDHSCIQSVTLVIEGDTNNQITLTRAGEIHFGIHQAISLPYHNGITEIRRLSSIFVQVKTTFGLSMQFDKEGGRLYLRVESSWRGSTVGLCGTYNGNLRDDFLSPVGMIEGTPQLHANAWKISSACVTLLSIPLVDPCDTNQQNALYSSTMCDILNQELFAPCHSFVNPSPYYQQCRYDACKCGSLCMCTALAHYAYLCARYKIHINFRSVVSECGVICPTNMLYHICSSSCGRTCQSLSINEICDDDCTEGCNCPNGTFYDEIVRRCVAESQCSCHFMGGIFQAGEVTFSNSGPCLCRNGRVACAPTEPEPQPGKCPNNKRYFDCRDPQPGLPWTGAACEVTCENLMMNITCSPLTPCISGCVCPPGLIKHGGDCFLPENCPCSWKGQEYLPGEVVSTVCYSCICQRGVFNCTYHPCPAVCTIYSDRHYRSFDGLEYDYVSDCQVYLVKSTASLNVSIITQNVDCYDSGIICMKSLMISIGGTHLYFNDNSGKPSLSGVRREVYDFQLWKAGYYSVIHYPVQEITVFWDKKTTVHIQVGPQWQGRMTGLCGNFDKNTANDMTTSNNMEVSNAQAFGDSWALGQCVSRNGISRPCEADLIRQPFAKRECAILYSEVFAPCHNVVDVTWFYKNCLTDTCNCNRGGDCECFCTSVGAYAHTCCQKGAAINWRSPSVCPFDCEYYNRDLGEGPFIFINYLCNDTVIANNKITGSIVPLQINNAGQDILMNFMITPGLYKAKQSQLPVVSLESAERPNYFIHIGENDNLHLEQWEDNQRFHKDASFIHHQSNWIPGYSTFELYSRKGFFITLTRSAVKIVQYDSSESFKLSSSFRIEESSKVIPYRTMCEFRYEACASPCIKTCSDPHAIACKFLPPVEGCMAHCPKNMLLDEVTHRCVHLEDLLTRLVKHNLTLNNDQCTYAASEIDFLGFRVTAAGVKPTHNNVKALHALLTLSNVKGLTSFLGTTNFYYKFIPKYAEIAEPLRKLLHQAAEWNWTVAQQTAFETLKAKIASLPVLAHFSPRAETYIATDVSGTAIGAVLSQSIEGSERPIAYVSHPLTFIFCSNHQMLITLLAMSGSGHRHLRMYRWSDRLHQHNFAVEYLASSRNRVADMLVVVLAVLTIEKHTGARNHSLKLEIGFESNNQIATTKLIHQYQFAFASNFDKIFHIPNVTLLRVQTSKLMGINVTATDLPYLQPTTTSAITEAAYSSPTTLLTPTAGQSTSSITDQYTSMKSTPRTAVPTITTVTTKSPVTTSALAYKTSFTSTEPSILSSTRTTMTPVGSSGATSATAAVTSQSRTHIYTTEEILSSTSTALSSAFSTIATSTRSEGIIYSTHDTVSTAHPAILKTQYSIPTETTETTTVQRTSTVGKTETSTEKITRHSVAPFTTTRATLTPEISVITETTQSIQSTTVTSPVSVSATSVQEKTTSEAFSASQTFPFNLTSPPSMTPASPQPETAITFEQYGVDFQFMPSDKTSAMDWVLVNVNVRENQCPFNMTQPSCGFLGMPVQINNDRCCPQWECPCRCSMFSDLHIITFDGNDVGVYDAAAYVLTLLPQETIVAHIEQCPTGESANSIRRPVPGGNSGLCFKKLNITSRNHKVIINRLERLTTVNSRPARLPFTKLGFHIQDTGAMYLISTPAGVTIQWYRSTGIIVLEFGLPSNRTIGTKGLCGCCNGSPVDDLKLPNGTIVTEVESIGLFLESWMVETSGLETDCFRCRKQNCTIGNCTACFDMLNQNPWILCHQHVTPEIFCELWIRDFHYVTHQCDALALYAAACNKYNVCIPWRTPEFCPLSCPIGMEYQPCVPACESKTCQNKDFYLEHDSTCSFISESCVCPRGTVLHQPDSNYCVTEEQCACTDNEGRPRSAGETWNGSHKGCCMYKCLENGTIIAMEPECGEVSSPMCEREGEIIIDVIEEGACCPKKICECNLTICGTDVLTCENGDKLVIGYSAVSCCPEYRCECDPLACPTSSPPVCREDQFLVEVRKDDSCCFSFQCVCESCIDPIPTCNEGNILAVDLNTTDRCCPLYHCICDENLCPPPDKSCTVGTKLVKRPISGICCPDWQCDCNCENTTIISCKAGEVLTEDHGFQHVCGCTRSVCKKADVCLFQDVTALKPGQSLFQHLEGDRCYIANCLQNTDPATESPSIEVSIVNCSAKCEAHQVYVPSTDPHVCCGTCKNMSCTFEEDGSIVLYNAGTSWVSNCIRYECLETTVGVAMLGTGIVCPPFNETECIQKGGVLKLYMDGCCKTCSGLGLLPFTISPVVPTGSTNCDTGKEDRRPCRKLDVKMIIRKDDCRTTGAVIVASCDGKCPSAMIFNTNINNYARFCKCCREVELTVQTVPLFCAGNATWIDFTFQEPTDCSCQWN
ncbi:otogelin-like protein [Heterodontus francisci]|uniref:otogelin-like protein n=1 Tax=Heterodontus francisci TaxID=7792 RepID=UPI00355AE8E0